MKTKSFTQQFSHVYNKRLVGLKAAVRGAAEARWGGTEGGGDGVGGSGRVRFVDRLVNMQEGEDWVVIGTTYKVRTGRRPERLTDRQDITGMTDRHTRDNEDDRKTRDNGDDRQMSVER